MNVDYAKFQKKFDSRTISITLMSPGVFQIDEICNEIYC